MQLRSSKCVGASVGAWVGASVGACHVLACVRGSVGWNVLLCAQHPPLVGCNVIAPEISQVPRAYSKHQRMSQQIDGNNCVVTAYIQLHGYGENMRSHVAKPCSPVIAMYVSLWETVFVQRTFLHLLTNGKRSFEQKPRPSMFIRSTHPPSRRREKCALPQRQCTFDGHRACPASLTDPASVHTCPRHVDRDHAWGWFHDRTLRLLALLFNRWMCYMILPKWKLEGPGEKRRSTMWGRGLSRVHVLVVHNWIPFITHPALLD